LVAKGVVESFWVLFSVKKYLPLPGMRAEKTVLKRLKHIFNLYQNPC
jgi:hypothetical protein